MTVAETAIFLEKFKGKNFVLCGKFACGMEEDRLQMYLEALSANISRHVDATTDYLVAARGSNAEKNKAVQLNNAGAKIEIFSPNQLMELLKPDDQECLRLLRSGRSRQLIYHNLCNWIAVENGLDIPKLKNTFDFRRADLSGLTLSEIPFYIANLNHSNFSDTTLDYMYIERIKGACFARAKLTLSRSTEIELTERCDFQGATISGVIFRWKAKNCDFSNGILSGVMWLYANFDKCKFVNANLQFALISRGKFIGCDLSGADLSGADLRCADLTGANLSNANLTDTNLLLADLSNCDLTGAKLDRTILLGADLTGAIVENCDFSNAIVDSNLKNETTNVALKRLQKVHTVHGSDALVYSMIANLNGIMLGIKVFKQDGWHVVAGTSWLTEECLGTYDTFSEAIGHIARLFPASLIDMTSFRVSVDDEPFNPNFLEKVVPELYRVFEIEPPDTAQINNFEVERSVSYRALTVELIKGGERGVMRWNQNRGLILPLVKDFRNLDFSNSDVSGAVLVNDLELSNFDRATEQLTRCSELVLAKSNFKNCSIFECQFFAAVLEETDFSNSKVTRTNFMRAKLAGSKLRNATFEGCSFVQASLIDVDLSDSKFEKCIWTDCEFDDKTIFPIDFEIPVEMIWVGAGPNPLLARMYEHAAQGTLCFEDLVFKIQKFVQYDRARIKKALSMLKKKSFKLYSDLSEHSLTGVVKSHSNSSRVYACRLGNDGAFSCCTQNLRLCGGLKGAPCKHLLVLLLGLAKAGELPLNIALVWMQASSRKKPHVDQLLMSEIFLRYKSAEAGEIDWRPTETIPEDYYSF
ncbi:MAG: pentapeptide repeat-containing protein [Candidatus Melainabacteria bacterium]|nr:pentapeptide repeat-containing protein [Candidatus Melainabacteria bacterium]